MLINVNMSKAIFVSDLHLVDPDDAKTKLFVSFLAQAKHAGATHLFLVGDIFDLWVSDHGYFTDKFSNVVREIQELITGGVEVHYFEGNHDLHLTKFWRDQIGAQVHKDHATFDLSGLVVRVEHGDLINPDDHGYLFLRRLLRSAPMTFLSHHLPAFAVKAIGENASRASRDYTSNAKARPVEEIRQMIRAHAESMRAQSKFDVIISGHVHVTDDFTFKMNDREVRSINLGSWFEPPKALVIDAGGIRFEAVAPVPE